MFNVFSHLRTRSTKAPTKREPEMVCRLSMLSSSSSLRSSAARRMKPRSWPSFLYFTTTRELLRQAASIFASSFSIFASCTASLMMSSTRAVNLCNSMVKMLLRVSVFREVSKATPVTSMSFCQWRVFMESFLRFTTSGKASLKFCKRPSTILNVKISFSSLGNRLAVFSRSSAPFCRTEMSRSPQSIEDMFIWKSLNCEYRS